MKLAIGGTVSVLGCIPLRFFSLTYPYPAALEDEGGRVAGILTARWDAMRWKDSSVIVILSDNRKLKDAPHLKEWCGPD